ncbi:hypothetical protein AKJ35_01040 [candidate division MSBL1 archaeon SCGC-AAA833F18]|uniref:Uncharacterized protein n=1 Tax=candidate division MSBL1 archaeon SCGC-AAA833F18 TaxID=1698257 RepID=A0A133VS85_9EURY|nr:hypothetical protein AKJ35_01040 [candidate division MSBL1 archaeon SCGC-AAA833F18]
MEGGLFVTLYDEKTLKLYLENGVYGQHMPPEMGEPSSYSNHYRVLGDYACCRKNNHVFFFLKRKIVYAGQILGSRDHGSFYLNGGMSPMGREANAPLVWDESKREIYESTEDPGLFKVKVRNGKVTRCQPFLIRFEDNLDLAGDYIISDQFYFKLGEYPYPLPSNSISGMGFCTLTPGETNTLLELLENEPEGSVSPISDEDVELEDEPIPYSPKYGIENATEATTESHLEASVIANPKLLLENMHPGSAVICRQVPISPFKPRQMDRADMCYYGEMALRNGTIPDTVIELKVNKAGKQEALQVERYLKWLHKRLGDEAKSIEVYVFAPGFKRTFPQNISDKFQDQIQKVKF